MGKLIYKFQVQHKNTYKTRIISIKASNNFEAKQELYRCFPNYNWVNDIK